MTRPIVLIAIKGLGIGGAEKLVAEGARKWDRDRFDYRVAYFLPWKDQLVGQFEDIDVPVNCLGTKRGLTPSAISRFRQHVKAIEPDIVHVHSPAVAIALRMLTSTPIVHTEHNLADSYRLPTRILNRLTYGRNSAVTAVSASVADSLTGFPGPQPQVIANGVSVSVSPVDAAELRSELGLATGDRLVIHVGNIRPGKGHRNLIEATRSLPRDVKVVSMGVEKFAGDLARMREASIAAGVQDQIRFLGRREDALAFIAAADVYVNPAEHEGLPVTILEALALEKPVVATAVGGVPSVVHDGETGLLVPPGQPAQLAAAIVAVLADPAKAAEMAARGRSLVEEKHGLEPMIKSFEALYSEVLGG